MIYYVPMGGGSKALDKNCPTDPSRRSLMLSANSCNGVRNISGVMNSSNFSYLIIKTLFILKILVMGLSGARKSSNYDEPSV